MLILVYNEDTNKIERYNRTLGQPMPYVNNSYLTVKEFRGSSKSTILWTTKSAMRAFYNTRARFGPIYVGYAFKRILKVAIQVNHNIMLVYLLILGKDGHILKENHYGIKQNN